jgi:hypothetical protein
VRITTNPLVISSDWTKCAWVDIGPLRPSITIEINGILSGDKVKIFVSNRPQKPPLPGSAGNTESAYTGQLFGSEISANGMQKITESYRWLLVLQSATSGGGTVTAWYHSQIQDER